jgi:hypothetical protein
MKFLGTSIGFATLLLLASGCAHHLRVNSVALAESGTYVVATPGALTIARQSASSSRSCTLRTGGAAKGKHGKRAGRAGKRGAGAAKTLDVLLFRLCEARANNDITPAEYASSVELVLKTMSEMAARRPPPPRPGARARGPWGPEGPRGMWRRDRDRRDRGERRDRTDRPEKGAPARVRPEGAGSPPGGAPAGPAKGKKRKKQR